MSLFRKFRMQKQNILFLYADLRKRVIRKSERLFKHFILKSTIHIWGSISYSKTLWHNITEHIHLIISYHIPCLTPVVGLCYPRWPNQAVSCGELPIFQSRSPECAHRKEHVKRPLCFQSGCTHIISWWYQPYHVNSIIISEPYSEQISMPKFYHIHIISKHVRNIFISFLFDQKQIQIISYHMHKNLNDIIFALLHISETCQILLMSTHFMSKIFLFSFIRISWGNAKHILRLFFTFSF